MPSAGKGGANSDDGHLQAGGGLRPTPHTAARARSKPVARHLLFPPTPASVPPPLPADGTARVMARGPSHTPTPRPSTLSHRTCATSGSRRCARTARWPTTAGSSCPTRTTSRPGAAALSLCSASRVCHPAGRTVDCDGAAMRHDPPPLTLIWPHANTLSLCRDRWLAKNTAGPPTGRRQVCYTTPRWPRRS